MMPISNCKELIQTLNWDNEKRNNERLYIWNFEPLDCLITKIKERFRDRVLTHEVRQIFYLD